MSSVPRSASFSLTAEDSTASVRRTSFELPTLTGDIWSTGVLPVDLRTVTEAVGHVYAHLKRDAQAKSLLEKRINQIAQQSEEALHLARNFRRPTSPLLHSDDSDDNKSATDEDATTAQPGSKRIPGSTKLNAKAVDEDASAPTRRQKRMLTPSTTEPVLNFEEEELSPVSLHRQTLPEVKKPETRRPSEIPYFAAERRRQTVHKTEHGDDDDQEMASRKEKRRQIKEHRLQKIEMDIIFNRKQVEQTVKHDLAVMDLKMQRLEHETERRALPSDIDQMRCTITTQLKQNFMLDCRAIVASALTDKTQNIVEQVKNVIDTVEYKLGLFDERLKAREEHDRKILIEISPLERQLDNHQHRLDDMARRLHTLKIENDAALNKMGFKLEKAYQSIQELEPASMDPTDVAPSKESSDSPVYRQRQQTQRLRTQAALDDDLAKEVNSRFQGVASKHDIEELRRTLEDKIKDMRLVIESELLVQKDRIMDDVRKERAIALDDIRKEAAIHTSEIKQQIDRTPAGVNTSFGTLRAELQEWLEDAKAGLQEAFIDNVVQKNENMLQKTSAAALATQLSGRHGGNYLPNSNLRRDSQHTMQQTPQMLHAQNAEVQASRAANAAVRQRVKLLEVRLTAIEEWAAAGYAASDAQGVNPERAALAVKMEEGEDNAIASGGTGGSDLNGAGRFAGRGRSESKQTGTTGQGPARIERRLEELESNLKEHVAQTHDSAKENRHELSNIARVIHGVQRQAEQSGGRLEDVFKDVKQLKTRTEDLFIKFMKALQDLRGGGVGAVGEESVDIALRAGMEAMVAEDSGVAATSSLAALRADVQSELGQLRQEVQDELSRKANRIEVQSLSTKVHCALGPDSYAHRRPPTRERELLPLSGRGSPDLGGLVLSGGDAVALARWPRCLSCDTPVEVISEAGRLRTVVASLPGTASPTPARMLSPTPPPGSSSGTPGGVMLLPPAPLTGR